MCGSGVMTNDVNPYNELKMIVPRLLTICKRETSLHELGTTAAESARTRHLSWYHFFTAQIDSEDPQ
jgi:hypothetical protein